MLKILFTMSLIFSTLGHAQSISYERSLNYLLKNISPTGTKKGIVVASPSKYEPNYFFHWVRDAGLVMSTVFDLYEHEKRPLVKKDLEQRLFDYASLVKTLQRNSGFDHLGEPKYNIDGTPYTGPWGRPQNDGPALRAITLIKFANKLLDDGKVDWVRNNLYQANLNAHSPIKMDLEFVSHRFHYIGFDYWEEIRGFHFSTAMGQRRALLMGAKLATRLKDNAAASWYFLQAKKIEQMIEKFWNPNKGFIQATINQQGGFWKSQLDISAILGVHHGAYDNFYSVSNKKVVDTVIAIEKSFNQLYQINNNKEDLGVAIGRYPEDTYDGYHTNRIGHAWFLATFAMAEYHLRLKNELATNKNVKWNYAQLYKLLGLKTPTGSINISMTQEFILKSLDKKADAFFKRANFHAAKDGHMSEQMNRYSGFMEGAKDLTWSYASHLSALLWR